jgi:type III secretion protein Y
MNDVAATAELLPSTDTVDLLHCLGFLYLRHGQARRSAVLLMVAARSAPDRPDILRTLAAALIATGIGDSALGVLDRLEALEPGAGAHRMMRLMRARALRLLGRGDEARAVFRSAAEA